jgi:hypothetical protein
MNTKIILPPKNCLRCGVSSNDERFEFILNIDKTPKAYRSRCYYCRHPNQKKEKIKINSPKTTTSFIQIDDIEEEEELITNNESSHCWYTGLQSDKLEEIKLSEGEHKIVKVHPNVIYLKGNMSDRNFNKIISYLKIYSKKKDCKRRIKPFEKLSTSQQEYLMLLAFENNISLDNINQMRIDQNDCCYLSNVLMTWDPKKWNKGVIENNKLVIPLFSKLEKIMTYEDIKDLLNRLIMYDKCS